MGFETFPTFISIRATNSMCLCVRKKVFSVERETPRFFVQTFTKRILNCPEAVTQNLTKSKQQFLLFSLSHKNVNDALFVKMVEFDINNNDY